MSDEEERDSDSDGERMPEDYIFTRQKDRARTPIRMFLHRSLGQGGKQALAEKIYAAGGDPSYAEDEAEVIICRDDQPIFKKLQFKYDHSRYIWVEAPSWVDTCIMRRKYEHVQPTQRNNARRVAFTEEDDQHLVEFLALRIPYKDMEGRNGNGLYKDLCGPERMHTYPWAKRHTWHSWRERYTKNKEYFDPLIERAVKKDPDPPKRGGKGQYVIPRKPKLRHTVQNDDDDDMEEVVMDENDEEEEEEEVTDVPAKAASNQSRAEDGMRRGPQVEQPSPSPPRKKRRIQSKKVESEDEDEDNGETNKRHERLNQDFAPREDGVFRPYPGGPSQFESSDLESDLPLPPVATSNSVQAKSHHGLAAPNLKPSKARETMAPLPPRKTVAPNPAQPVASSSRLPDSQRTFYALSQVQRDLGSPPPDTQATLVDSSQEFPPPQPGSPPRARRAPVPRQPVYANTRSRARSASAELAPAAQSSSTRRGKKAQQPQQLQPPPEAPLPGIQEESQVHSMQVPGGASFRDEERVEELLQPEIHIKDAEGYASSSSDESTSSDDEAAKILRDESKKMIHRPPGRLVGDMAAPKSPVSKDSRDAGSANARKLPHIDISSLAHGSTSRKAPGLQISRAADENDNDATPKQKSRVRAAKKIASRVAPPIVSQDEDTDARSEKTETTVSSFPAEVTNARQYKTAQSPFTPAPGTKAEERVRRARYTREKGKARA